MMIREAQVKNLLNKKRRINGLIRRKAFEAVSFSEIPKQANILGWKFVIVTKNAGTQNEICTARFVVQWHADADENMLVHSSGNPRQRTIWLITAIASIYQFNIWSQHLPQDYL